MKNSVMSFKAKVGTTLLFIAAAIAMAASCDAEQPGGNAVAYATKYVQEQNGTTSMITCKDKDGNGDGYVVCAILFKSNVFNVVSILSVECPMDSSKGVACRKATGNLKNK